MARADQGAAKGARNARQAKPKPPPVTLPPAGDIASSGGDYGTRKAKAFKATPKYRETIRQVYAAQPTPRKRELLKTLKGPEGATVRKEHAARTGRNQDLAQAQAQHDIIRNADLEVVRKMLGSREYQKTIGEAAHAGALQQGLSQAQASERAGRAIEQLKSSDALSRYSLDPLFVGASAVFNVGRATVENPEAVLTNTAKSVPGLAAGTVAGLADLAIHPKDIAKIPTALRADLKRRYGPLAAGDSKAFRERIKKEGFAPEAIDIAGVVAPEATVSGRALGAAGRAGMLGPRIAKLTTEARPLLRTAAGTDGARPQDLSRNLFVATGQKAVDRSRRKAFEKRQGAALDKTVPADERPTVRGLAPQAPNEVVRRRVGGGTLDVLPSQAKDQRRQVAGRQGRAHLRQRNTQDRELNQGSRRNLRKLTKEERRAFKYSVQLGLPADRQAAVQALTEHRANIAAAREAGGITPARTDELHNIDAILAAPDKHLTPRLRQIADVESERATHTAALDPSITPEIAAHRALADQAMFLLQKQQRDRRAGQTVSDPLPTPRIQDLAGEDLHNAVQSARQGLKDAERELARQQRTHEESVAGFGVARGRAQILSRNVGGVRAERAAEARTVPAGRPQFEGGGHGVEQAATGLRKSTANVEKAKAALQDAEKAVADARQLETISDYVKRVGPERIRKAARAQGLTEPGYFMSRERPVGVASSFTAGAGNRAVAGAKRNTGALFATGRQDANPEAFVTGLARNIKRDVNWNMVSDIWEANTPSWGRNQTPKELRDELDRRGLDAEDWRLVDPGVLRRERDVAQGTDATTEAGLERQSTGQIHEALGKATFTLNGAEAEFKGTGQRFSLLPRPVADELLAGTRPAGAALRTFQKLQGTTSRLLLNLNPTFVPVQIIGQTPLSVFAMRGNVKDLLAGQRWYRKLDKDTKATVDEYLGVSAMHSATSTPRYGAAADSSLTRFFRAVVDSDRAQQWKRSGFNPMTWNPYFDEKQNAFFRRAVFYNQVKRQARDRIGAEARALQREAQPLMKVLEMPAGDAKVRALREHELQIEKAADHVDEMLGNYLRYTARERSTLKTALLFYGFLRWSVRFTFYTMPVKHPIATSIAAKLGQLHNEEVIDLLSDNAVALNPELTKAQAERELRDQQLPFAFGRLYFGKAGHLKSIDLARANPFSNPLLEALQSPKAAATGLVSPALQAAQGAIFGTDSFGRKVNVHGEKTPPGEDPQLGPSTSARIAARTFGMSLFPVRMADALRNPDQQGADSLPILGDRPTVVKSPVAQERAAAKLKAQGDAGQRARAMLLPFVVPKGDTTASTIAYKAALRQRRDKRRQKPKAGKGSGDGVSLPEVNLPEVTLPDVSLPEVKRG